MPVLSLAANSLAVGQVFQSRPEAFTSASIKTFAAQFDPQPFHLDEEAARESPFGGLVASGWHAASVAMRLIVESMPLACGLIGLGGTLHWLQPVRPGDALRVTSRITKITLSRTKPGQAVMELSCDVKNQTDQLVIAFVSNLMLFGYSSKA